jgi:hypothetical protein
MVIMNATKTVHILGRDYPKDNIKYSYTGSKMRYKRFIKYPAIFYLLITVVDALIPYIIVNQYLNFANKQTDFNIKLQVESSMLNVLSNIKITYTFLAISAVIAFIILLIPRISCLFLKIDGNKKDIVLYKSIHKDEVALIANEINTRIKENNFSSFPY